MKYVIEIRTEGGHLIDSHACDVDEKTTYLLVKEQWGEFQSPLLLCTLQVLPAAESN